MVPAWLSRSVASAVDMAIDKVSLVTIVYPVVVQPRARPGSSGEGDSQQLLQPEPEPEPEAQWSPKQSCDLVSVRHYTAGTAVSIMVNGVEALRTMDYAYGEVDLPFKFTSAAGGMCRGNLHIAEVGVLKYAYTLTVNGRNISDDPFGNPLFGRAAPFGGPSVRIAATRQRKEKLGGATVETEYTAYQLVVDAVERSEEKQRSGGVEERQERDDKRWADGRDSEAGVSIEHGQWRRYRDFEALHRLMLSYYVGHLRSNVP